MDTELYKIRLELMIQDCQCPENYNKSEDLYNKAGGFFVKPFQKSIFQWYACFRKRRKQHECVCISDKSPWTGDPDCI